MRVSLAERSADAFPRHRGVSVIVCCHNSAQRLEPTLANLAAQRVEPSLEWEVVIIDNGSTDGTAETATRLWPLALGSRLRVVREDRLGLTYARHRGLAEARFEYVSFIDDDNWICDTWVSTVASVFDSHSDVGMCGGEGTGAFEGDPPPWFAVDQASYAVGSQASSAGYLACGYLWGAGLSLRRSAWFQLVADGFAQILSDRQGKALCSGGDTEICMALNMAGWRQWYEPALKYVHFMPAGRLTWTYLRRLYRGFGNSWAAWEPYVFVQRFPSPTLGQRMRQLWLWRLQAACRHLLRTRKRAATALESGEEARLVLNYESAIGTFLYLLGDGRHCGKHLRAISRARWRRPPAGEKSSAEERQQPEKPAGRSSSAALSKKRA